MKQQISSFLFDNEQLPLIFYEKSRVEIEIEGRIIYFGIWYRKWSE